MKKTENIITAIIYFVYFLLWCFIVSFAILVKHNGLFDVFRDAFGRWSLILGLLTAVLVMLSPTYLRKLLGCNTNRRRLKISILSVTFTLAFVILSFMTFYLATLSFQKFTPEKWQMYPKERYIMIEDLKENHKIIGMEYSEVIELLGEPDALSPAGYLSYSYIHGNIEISLDSNNRVLHVYVH